MGELTKVEVLFWEAVEHDLHTDGDHTFGVELDLFNNHKIFYHKLDLGKNYLVQHLTDDVYESIEMFNFIKDTGGTVDDYWREQGVY